ncbi:MAG: Rieske (2Fe-2S) protein [Acidobacteriota bacterium]
MSLEPEKAAEDSSAQRRRIVNGLSSLAMGAGLLAGYGFLAGLLGRFLFPSGSSKGWMFVMPVGELDQGQSLTYKTPAGATVVIARQERTGRATDFIALSSTCPHLGCQVRWEGHNNRFFCPCHNGVFDPSGVALEGPPAQAGQSLPRYPLKVEKGLLFIEVPTQELAMGPGRILPPTESPCGPGHDPCLGELKMARGWDAKTGSYF